jgi:hypothetical protein
MHSATFCIFNLQLSAKSTCKKQVRQLRHAGGFTNNSCGIHIHLDGADHTPRSIRNFVNIIASKNDLFYKALQIAPERMSYCKKMDSLLVEKLNRRKPKTMGAIETLYLASVFLRFSQDLRTSSFFLPYM